MPTNLSNRQTVFRQLRTIKERPPLGLHLFYRDNRISRFFPGPSSRLRERPPPLMFFRFIAKIFAHCSFGPPNPTVLFPPAAAPCQRTRRLTLFDFVRPPFFCFPPELAASPRTGPSGCQRPENPPIQTQHCDTESPRDNFFCREVSGSVVLDDSPN